MPRIKTRKSQGSFQSQGVPQSQGIIGHWGGSDCEGAGVSSGGCLGDEWRWFSYYKALSVLEKLPFRIRSSQQVQGLPSIGSSLEGKVRAEADAFVAALSSQLRSAGAGAAQSIGSSQQGKQGGSNRAVWESLLKSLKSDSPIAVALFAMRWQHHQSCRHRQSCHLEVAAGAALVVEEGRRCSLGSPLCVVGRIAGARRHQATWTSLSHTPMVPGRADFIIFGRKYRRGKATLGNMGFIITHPDGTSVFVCVCVCVCTSTHNASISPCNVLTPSLASPSHHSHRGFLEKLVSRLKLVGFLSEDLMVGTHHSLQVMRGCKVARL
ncbi:unnamed protein product [Closterium sp. NIES-53]